VITIYTGTTLQDVNNDANDAKITAALLEFQQAIRANNKAIVERNEVEANAWESDKELKGQKYYAYNTLLKEVMLLLSIVSCFCSTSKHC
jgi:hypothetical protein